MRFSVVIVNYASWPYTLRCIESLLATGYEDFEIVVVDNGGSDSDQASRLSEGVTLVRNLENVGFARACNQGVATAQGDTVVLLNPDTLVESNFFKELETFLAERPEAGIVGPGIVEANGELQRSARREVGALSGLVSRTSLLTRLFPKSRFVRDQFPEAGPEGFAVVDWVSGACLAVRRRVLEKVGPLDGRFFMYFEDADLCRRAREAGWEVCYLPRLKVLHHTGASSRNRPRAVWLLHRSAFLYHLKHGPSGPLGLYNAVVFLGLCTRMIIRLAAPALPQRRKSWERQEA